MAEIARFPFSTVRNALGEIALRPILPVTLSHQGISIEAARLLDTGADVKVLPASACPLAQIGIRRERDCGSPAISPSTKHAGFWSSVPFETCPR